MQTAILLLSAAGAAVWVGRLLLPWRPWLCRETLEPLPEPLTGIGRDLTDVTAVIPARDEAALIGACLRSLAGQGRGIRVVVVDDGSSDGTAEAARQAGHAAGLSIEVVKGKPLPDGWTGKLWALEQGTRRVRTPLTLLMDADIALGPGTVAALLGKREREGAVLVSLMATPWMEGFWEKLLMPAFVYFFKLLYPFALSNSPRSRVAAAAGGCVLLDTDLLRDIGGLAAIRGRVIDDCALAERVKERLRQEGGTHGPRASSEAEPGQAAHEERPGRTWIGLSHGARSLRSQGGLAGIWNMVARTAFAQLRYSVLLLGACTVAMLVAYWGPVTGAAAALGLLSSAGPDPGGATAWISGVGLAALAVGYLPTLRFYGRSPLWVLLLPAIGTLYLFMTWSSAVRHWRGEGARWKGRSYPSPA